ncbi:MAG: hypothetical protein CMP40_01870 [Rickettsiales bacterium]|nr:hypothetical protein [Rickettsiales bacterium]
MDDSVIKVLRRNGSWQKSINNQEKKRTFNSKVNDFSLDENFGVLAEEIKKRMKNKSLKKSDEHSKAEDQYQTEELEIIKEKNHNDNIKKKLLPFLKEIDLLIDERDINKKKIEMIDAKLDAVKKQINIFKHDYEKSIRKLQENINLFDESIDVINSVKGDNNDG